MPEPDFEQRRANINKLQKESNARYIIEKAEAKAYALLNNIPMKMTLEDGGFAELQKIVDGNPIYYRTFNSAAAESTRADRLNTGGGMSLDLNGNGLTAHVWDGGHARITHQEYDGPGGSNRVTLMDTGDEGGTQLNFHAAHVTGTVCATGVQAFNPPYGTSKGMAWQSQVRGYMWNNDLSEATSQVDDGSVSGSFNNGYDMLLSNHSYGAGASFIPDSWFGQYGPDAANWDNLMYNAPYYLMVVAAGNDGDDDTSNASPLNGNTSFDKLSWLATAKNTMVVANGQDAVISASGDLTSVLMNSSTSEGPTDDFRIKPDIMGNGTLLASTGETNDADYILLTGTSMAAPNVTGTLLLLQEHYYDVHTNFMRSATLKGLALHTADDVEHAALPMFSPPLAAVPAGPDVYSGWGLLNGKVAAETITNDNAGTEIIDERTLINSSSYSVDIASNGMEPLLVSISWTDPAGTSNTGTNSSTPALVNDLDVRLTQGATTSTPWRLTGVNSNGVGDNTVDPYERIDVIGASGIYELTVTHKGTLVSPQEYTVIVTGGSYYIACIGVTKTWNGSNWSPSGAPGTTDTAIIDGTYDVAADGNIDVCQLTINAGAILTVDADTYLRVQNDITVNGTLIVNHQGSVVQVEEDAKVTNNGTIHVDVTTPTLKPRDFMVLGTPMSMGTPVGQTNPILRVLNLTTTNFRPNPDVQVMFPGGTNFVDEDNNDWSHHAGDYNAGEGYYVWPQADLVSGNQTYDLRYSQGTLNTGVVTYTLDYNTTGTETGTAAKNKNASPSVISNPYASAINASAFIAANVAIDEIYLWEHVSTPSPAFPGANTANFNMADISTYNGTTFNPAATNPGATLNNSISTGQGFGVKANASGTATFNNSMRTTSNNNTLRTSETEINSIWLRVSNTQYELGSTTAIAFTEGATSGLEAAYDSRRLGVPVSIYSHILDGTQELGIQGREAFVDNMQVGIGFSSQIDEATSYSISIHQLEGELITSADVLLIDHVANTVTNLNKTAYNFESAAGTQNNRFTLEFRSSVLGTSAFDANSINVFPNPTDGLFTIYSQQYEIRKVTITDVQGRIITSFAEQNRNSVTLDVSSLKAALYFVTIATTQGDIVKQLLKK